ncbi:MAG: DEAD/DEAH box helicase [Firmicutes bacterium]|mgnify:CR=1 FL=1|nr:DEAD/DEAH box helicase [Bacillota bacterium]HQD39840.1 SNF2-related protein [Bacillota bacterium]
MLEINVPILYSTPAPINLIDYVEPTLPPDHKPHDSDNLPSDEDPISVYFPTDSEERLLAAIKENQPADWDWFQLALSAEELVLRSEPEKLIALDNLSERWRREGIIPYPHQLETARRVIGELSGQAILADEVGLGKTIEAGLIIKEYQLRGLARKILILVPASLCRQWQDELYQKFDITAVINRSSRAWEHHDVIIASIDTAKRKEHREAILSTPYDLVVVDEAHKLKNERSQNYQFVSQIQKKHFLLLTATPMQNDLKELYNLINLLRPGLLGTYRSFKKRFMKDKRTPQNTAQLRSLLSQVMIRNKRSESTVQFPPRHVHSIPLSLKPQEMVLYRALTKFVRERARFFIENMDNRGVLPLITLQREVCSSSFAAAMTLAKMAQATANPQVRERLVELYQLAIEIEENTKAEIVLELLSKIGEKTLIFTEYVATQRYLIDKLQKNGIPTVGFDGSLSRGRKEWAKFLFSREAQVMVCTESGGEGLNLQFCSNLINYDLPWNPMRLEQRIGRIHRLGQTRPVHVFNLCTRDTIEEHVLNLLQEKIDMFQAVIGDLELMLGGLFAEGAMEKRIFQLIVNADSQKELLAGFAELNEELSGELENILEIHRQNDALLK